MVASPVLQLDTVSSRRVQRHSATGRRECPLIDLVVDMLEGDGSRAKFFLATYNHFWKNLNHDPPISNTSPLLLPYITRFSIPPWIPHRGFPLIKRYLDCHRTTQGTGGEVVIILQHLVEDMPLLGLFFPPSSCLTTLATRAPSRVFCHAVTVYAHYGAPFSCGWDLKFCFAVGKDLFLCLWC